ncbi:MAG: CDP-alcohol phosphatidyltransferase family protein [Lewinellaceae bacterium]|nr:CDP-alcohol phosphatidyltransferase family protein [Lewinellaceae bacterium]
MSKNQIFDFVPMDHLNNTAAIVLIPDVEAALVKIYGLTILERTFHALERGGVSTVFLPKTAEEKVGKVVRKNKEWKIVFRSFTEVQKVFGEIKDGLLVLSEPLVLDPKVPQGLIEKGKSQRQALIHKNNKIAYLPGKVPAKLPEGNLDISAWLDDQRIEWEAIDFQGLICNSVHNSAEKKAVKKSLIRSLTKPSDGWVSKNLNRPISTSISRVLAYTPITPNQFTIITGLVGVATGVFLAMGGYWNYLIGGFLFHFTSVLDGVDGELARLKFKSSPFGQWLDTLVDNLSYLAGLGGMIVGLAIHGASAPVKIAGILAVVFVVLALGSLYFYLLRFKAGGTLLNVKYGFQDGDGWFSKIMQYAAAFGKRDLFALLFFGLAIIGQLPMALGYIAIMAFFVFAFSVQAHFQASNQQA